MGNKTNTNILAWLITFLIGALAVAAILFGTQVISTTDKGVQQPQAPASRKDGSNPSAR